MTVFVLFKNDFVAIVDLVGKVFAIGDGLFELLGHAATASLCKLPQQFEYVFGEVYGEFLFRCHYSTILSVDTATIRLTTVFIHHMLRVLRVQIDLSLYGDEAGRREIATSLQPQAGVVEFVEGYADLQLQCDCLEGALAYVNASILHAGFRRRTGWVGNLAEMACFGEIEEGTNV